MKRLIIILFFTVLFAASGISFAQDDGNNPPPDPNNPPETVNNAPDDNTVAEGDFYAPLAPYGNWITLDNGVNVWHPVNVRPNWAPYKIGQWVWTDAGWYWNSPEPFGYIVYHYGRWYNDEFYGWIWVPDHVWAPAWVEWRYNDRYIGWAPLAPYAAFSVNAGITFSRTYETPMAYWHFVGYNRMCDPYVYRYYVPDRARYEIYSGTTYRTNYGYSNGRVIDRGVDVDYIRQRGGGSIVELRIQIVNDSRNSGRGHDNAFRAYVPTHQQLDVMRRDRDVQFQHAARSSSLDVTRVNIGNRGPAARVDNNRPVPGGRADKIDKNTPGRDMPKNVPPRDLPKNNPPQNKLQHPQPGWNNRANTKPANRPPQGAKNNVQKVKKDNGSKETRNNDDRDKK
jgi:hypothetical protein